MTDNKPTVITFTDDFGFGFGDGPLATVEQYELADRCVGSIFEALEPGEEVELKEGVFVLDEDLDLQEKK